MRLIDLLKNIDGITLITVSECNKNFKTGVYEEDELFVGNVWDCPWWVSEKYIDTTDEWEGISLTINKNNKPCLSIAVRDSEEPDED